MPRSKIKTPPKGTRVNVEASKITYDSKNRIAIATGSVEITYGKYVLVATIVTYDLAKDSMTANGDVRLKEPGGNVLEAEPPILGEESEVLGCCF